MPRQRVDEGNVFLVAACHVGKAGLHAAAPVVVAAAK